MIENPPSSAGDAGSIPGWGTRSHMHAVTKCSHATTKETASHNQGARLPQLRSGTTKINKLKKQKQSRLVLEED